MRSYTYSLHESAFSGCLAEWNIVILKHSFYFPPFSFKFIFVANFWSKKLKQSFCNQIIIIFFHWKIFNDRRSHLRVKNYVSQNAGYEKSEIKISYNSRNVVFLHIFQIKFICTFLKYYTYQQNMIYRINKILLFEQIQNKNPLSGSEKKILVQWYTLETTFLLSEIRRKNLQVTKKSIATYLIFYLCC